MNELILTEKNQEASKEYLLEIEKIWNLKQQLKSKKEMAAHQISSLQIRLAELEKESLLATDQEKIKNFIEKKKSIRLEIDEYRNIVNTKFNKIVKNMLDAKDIGLLKNNADNEIARFDNFIKHEREKLEQEDLAHQKRMRVKMENLDLLRKQHAYSQASHKHMAIKMDKTDW